MGAPVRSALRGPAPSHIGERGRLAERNRSPGGVRRELLALVWFQPKLRSRVLTELGINQETEDSPRRSIVRGSTSTQLSHGVPGAGSSSPANPRPPCISRFRRRFSDWQKNKGMSSRGTAYGWAKQLALSSVSSFSPCLEDLEEGKDMRNRGQGFRDMD
ncbi:uncharacterized protein LOC123399742 isoform X2 [Hordeum vulgare subsp. vulgare]|uniref:uncharacterized protein LOC123399742 isoform X2 n=1 Tax=Hordeum vulgare subsp. vulgare TaxID=112509 RepID=UPI001D1A4F19|nr:uncharacterized protein LOC123399742 isoform X2 [Hordeum vulgare subsp. vulgare]